MSYTDEIVAMWKLRQKVAQFKVYERVQWERTQTRLFAAFDELDYELWARFPNHERKQP